MKTYGTHLSKIELSPSHFLPYFLCQRSGVDFTNILRADFMHTDPKSAKNTVKPSVSFALLGYALVKCW